MAQVITDTEAEGPGRRFAIWTQGCPRTCAGCCNPEMRRPDGGTVWLVADLLDQLRASTRIEGISLLGGEPFAQASAAAAFCRGARAMGLTTLAFTGYTVEEIRALGSDEAGLLAELDLLIDGPYRSELPELHRRWVGSGNQRVHFLSDRYRRDDPRFFARNTVEIRLRGGELQLSGWPKAVEKVLR